MKLTLVEPREPLGLWVLRPFNIILGLWMNEGLWLLLAPGVTAELLWPSLSLRAWDWIGRLVPLCEKEVPTKLLFC